MSEGGQHHKVRESGHESVADATVPRNMHSLLRNIVYTID